MPQELDRIKELAGLQQEAEPQDTADNLISTVTKLAQDALEKSNFDLQPFRPLAPKIQKLVTIKSPNYDGSQADALYNIWNTYPTKNSDPKDTTNIAYHMKELISIGRNYLKLPPYNFDKFEKPALTAPQKQGLAALVKKYAKRKTYGGGGLIDGYLDYLAQTGIWTDAADEKEFDVALKKLGHKDLAAWEKRAQGEEFEQFLELAPITGQAQNDVAKVLGKGFENNEELISAASRYVRSLPETAVAEAPASGDQALANELSMYFAKLAKEMLQNMQRPNTNDLEYEEFVDIAQAFKGGIQAGLDEVNTSDFEFSSNPFGDFGRSINDGPDEELVKILAKYGYRPGPDGDNDEATIVKQQEETAVQPMPVLNAVKETPVTSQVDEAIKKARAQLKSFSNFDGLKPYTPKKK